jgi:hypothetical protein
MQIPPWLRPTDTLGAIQAGAQAGLAIRRANDEESQAGDRLRLAYDQLASSERRQSEEAKSKMQLAQASLALRSQQMDAMQSYRAGQLQAKTEADNIRRENMARLASQFQEREGRMSDQFGQRMDQTQAREDRLGDQFKTRMDELDKREANKAGTLDPASHALLNAAATDLRATQKSINKIDDEGGPSSGFLGMKGNRKQYEALKKREKDLLEEIKTKYQTPQQKGATTGSKAKLRWNPETGTIEAAQ